MTPLILFWRIKEALEIVSANGRVVFRGKDGVERSVAKIKVRGFDTLIVCEDD